MQSQYQNEPAFPQEAARNQLHARAKYPSSTAEYNGIPSSQSNHVKGKPAAYEPYPSVGRSENSKLRSWLINGGAEKVWLGLYAAANIIQFVYTFTFYKSASEFSKIRGILGYGLFFARSGAACVNLNVTFLLLPVCRNLISLLRNSFLAIIIPFDSNISFHKICGWAIVFFSALHTAAHCFNALHLDQATAGTPFHIQATRLVLTHPTGLTGALLVVLLQLIATSSYFKVRRHYFELFWYTHHLFVIWFGLLLLHGAYCVVRRDAEPYCIQERSWIYWGTTGILYLLERIVREWRSRNRNVYISKVIKHPSRCFEIQLKVNNLKTRAGQYVFVCCPEIGIFQYHPFTLTSSPEEDFISVHVRIVGDWTTDLANRLGINYDDYGERTDNLKRDTKYETGNLDVAAPITHLPRLLIDGPYGSASEDVFDYEVALCIGAGIGVTPFASVLKSIWYRTFYASTRSKLRKVYFIWVCRDMDAFEWFNDLLKSLEEEDLRDFLSVRIYLTGKLKEADIKNVVLNNDGGKDAITGLRTKTQFGRPNFDAVFHELSRKHPSTDIGVFFCGPKSLDKTLLKQAQRHNESSETGTQFFYQKERF